MKSPASAKSIDSGDYIGGVAPDVHPATNSRELLEVYRLHHDVSQAQGHAIDRNDGLWIPHPEFDHYTLTTILVAVLHGEVVGTLSLTRDGSMGLVSDKLFSQTNNLTRMTGRQVAEAWRFIVRASHPHRTDIAYALAAEALKRLKAGGIATCLISVAEEQAALLRTHWNAVTLIQNTTGVFLRCDLKNLPQPAKKPARV